MSLGYVISDLHLLSRRSSAGRWQRELESVAADAEFLVLNGDTFDFQWAIAACSKTTLQDCRDWLETLLTHQPRCRLHVLLGNHDCSAPYRELLDLLTREHRNLRWHELHLRLGRALFLHGEVAQRRMSPAALRAYRTRWAARRRRPSWLQHGYALVGRSRVDHALSRLWVSPRRASRRVHHYLSLLPSGVTSGVEDVYFGHTHHPFRDHHHAGLRFHNTGAAVHGSRLEILEVRP